MLKLTLSALIASSLLLGSIASANDAEESVEQPSTDIFDCNEFDWLKNCEAINKTAEEQPNAPLRVTDPTGLEFNFQPGTPSVMMRHLLNPTRSTAREVLMYDKAHYERAELAAELVRQEIEVLGGEMMQHLALANAAAMRQDVYTVFDKKVDIDVEDFRIFVFYDSECPHCLKQIPLLAELQQRHTGIQISMLQLNKDDHFLGYVKRTLNTEANYIPDERKNEYTKRIKATPTIWVQSNVTNQTTVLEGMQTADQLEAAIGRMK